MARGSTVPEFEAALAALQPGEVCGTLVASRYGLHVVQLHAHAPATLPSFESITERVAADLHAPSWREGVRQYIAILASRARIEGFAFDGAAAGPAANDPWAFLKSPPVSGRRWTHALGPIRRAAGAPNVIDLRAEDPRPALH